MADAGHVCDPAEVFRIPAGVLESLAGHLGVGAHEVARDLSPPLSDWDGEITMRAWGGAGFRLCQNCSGFHGWFVWIGDARLHWNGEKFYLANGRS